MKIGRHIEIHNVTGRGQGLWPWWLWIDFRIGRWWYVVFWMKWSVPCFFRSDDADGPSLEGMNAGTWFMGRSTWERIVGTNTSQHKDQP